MQRHAGDMSAHFFGTETGAIQTASCEPSKRESWPGRRLRRDMAKARNPENLRRGTPKLPKTALGVEGLGVWGFRV